MARFSGNQLDDDDDDDDEMDEIVVKEKRGNSWQERWWKNGGGPLPNKEEGEILEPDDNDSIEFMHIDEPPTNYQQQQHQNQQLVRHCNYNNEEASSSSWINSSSYHHQENRNNDDFSSSESHPFPSYELYPRRHLDHHHFTNSNRNQNKLSPWKKYIIVILVAILLQRYCPPPPPRQNHQVSSGTTDDEIHRQLQYSDHEIIHYSWREYLSYSGQTALKSLSRTSYVARYLFIGILKNVYEDGKDCMKRFIDYFIFKNKLERQCYGLHIQKNNNQIIMEPTDDTIIGSLEYLSKHIVGQKSPLKAISTALDAWSIMDSILTNNNNNNQKRRPLAIWLTGAEAVGKTETVKAITNYLYQSCDDQSETQTKILQLQAFDVFEDSSSDNDGEEEYYHHPTGVEGTFKNSINPATLQNIFEHVDAHGSTGCIIIIKHVGGIPHSHWIQFLKKIQQKKDLQWEDTIFFFTSEFGTRKINHALRSFDDISSIPYTQLQNSVRNEIDNHFEKHFKSGNFVNVVVPFFPLRYFDLKEIMKLKLNNLSHQFERKKWMRLQVADDVISHFVGPKYVDYIEWGNRQKNQNRPSYIFSKYGASQLDDGILLRTFHAKLARGFFNQPNQVAKISYDDPSDHLVIAWCDTNEQDELINCNHAWRGRID